MDRGLLLQIERNIGLPESTIATLDRRLGEEGVLSRGRRGQRRVPYEKNDIAYLVTGCLAVLSGRPPSAAAIASSTFEIGNLKLRKSQPEEPALSGLLAFATMGANPPRFVDVLATLVVEIIADTKPSSAVAAIGLTNFGEFHPSAWFELIGNARSGSSSNNWMKSRNLLFFGADPPSDQVSKEVRLPIKRLKAIVATWDRSE